MTIGRQGTLLFLLLNSLQMNNKITDYCAWLIKSGAAANTMSHNHSLLSLIYY